MNLSETAEILAALAALRKRSVPLALATIVSVSGSTYRRPGARLLVPLEGPPIGNLSGGCLEGEVEGVARGVIQSGEPRLEFYDLTADDEVVWGWGLGCNGAIEVLVEPGDQAAATADVLRQAIQEERSLAVVTVLESEGDLAPLGARLLVHPDGRRSGGLGDRSLEDEAAAAAESALEGAGTEIVSAVTARARLFVEVLEPPLRLLVCGAGHDAIPLVDQAAGLGWRVVVVDDRTEFLDRVRFPKASDFLETEPLGAAEGVASGGNTYAVVMSHNYLRDRDYLRAFLGAEVAYIGMLGPRARLERLLEDLAGEGVTVSEEDRARLHGPAGLDLGAEGPEEIAAAIVAEVLAVSRRRPARPLRERTSPIHDRPQAVGN